jgi:hypothetical protein
MIWGTGYCEQGAKIKIMKLKVVILLQMYYPQDRYCKESE